MKIVFCLPGKSFSGRFLRCWSELLAWCIRNGISVSLQQYYSCNIYYVRNMCLGGNILNGSSQKPFNGQLDYDYIMWIDSDIIFTVEQFKTLLNRNKDAVSGMYLMEDGLNYATVKNWDETFFIQNGYFKFMQPHDIENQKELIPVHYTGMGFMLIKKGVTESIEYPWFRPEFVNFGNNLKDFTMEDVAFCRSIIRNGYNLYVDPTVVVGHEKTRILMQ